MLFWHLPLGNNVYEKFTTINSICILKNIYKEIKVNKPLIVLKIKCPFPNCSATYIFTQDNDVLINKCLLNFKVENLGPILHLKGVDMSNFISKDKRTEIVNKLV